METLSLERPREAAEHRKEIRRIKGLQALHAGAIVLLLVLLWAVMATGAAFLIVPGFLLSFFLVFWLAARLLGLMADRDRAIARLKIAEFFPGKKSLVEQEEALEKEMKRVDLEPYKLD